MTLINESLLQKKKEKKHRHREKEQKKRRKEESSSSGEDEDGGDEEAIATLELLKRSEVKLCQNHQTCLTFSCIMGNFCVLHLSLLYRL